MQVLFDLSQIRRPLVLERRSALLGDAGHLGAFSIDDTLEMTLTVHRALCVSSVTFCVTDDVSGMERHFPLTWESSDRLGDRYVLRLPMNCLTKRAGLFWSCFALETVYGCLYSVHDDLHYPGVQREKAGLEQITVFTSDFQTPTWIRGGVMYHIFVDRFSRGGEVPCRPDARLEPDWESGVPEYAEVRGGRVENTTFFGGTLWGVAERMAYIASLGTRCIYLSPVFEARSNHKYDTGDYLQVDEMFGGEEALRAVIDRAAAYGIRVILDGVFNHTGDDSRYFNRYGHYPPEGACDSTASPYYPWYSFDHYPDAYRAWWDIDILPAVRSDRADYRSFICEAVVPKWHALGIGGWRLDVADELAPVFLEDFRRAVKSADDDGIIFGEVWEDASNKIAYDQRRRYFHGQQLDGVMNYPLREAIVAFVRDGDSRMLCDTVMTQVHNYPPQVLRVLMNHLGTHDTERILNVLAGVSGEAYRNAELASLCLTPEQRALGLARLRCAYVTVACLPGIPCIYYGDEAGMEGWRDPFNRLPFPWGREDADLLAHYRQLGQFRAESRVLAEGDIRFIEADKGSVLFSRYLDGEALLIAVNVGAEPYSFSVTNCCSDVFDGIAYALGEKICLLPMEWKILQIIG
ncbi:MAG: glycoside hydrolase family 13 protein [Clostridia bacterium]|nr:glycoside hydrolase family 13 protein [Clostridia bacterium]